MFLRKISAHHVVFLIMALLMIASVAPVMAQSDEELAAVGIAGLMGCGCIVNIVFYVIWIFVVVWMYRDAEKRGMDAPWVWILAGLFVPVISLIVYLLIRPSR